MTDTETRFVKANTRPEGSQGNFTKHIFQVTIPVTGDFHKTNDYIIAEIRKQGHEVYNIINHSKNRNTL